MNAKNRMEVFNRDGSRRAWRRRALLGAAAAVAIGSAIGATGHIYTANAKDNSAAAISAATAQRGAPASFADVAAKVAPAVVNMSVAKKTAAVNGADGGNGGQFNSPFPKGSPFEDFFRRFFEQQPQGNGGGNGAPVVQGQGSGFIIDAEGHVVTNNHVIDGADEITVILSDGKRYAAKLRGRDPKTDLALLKIEAEDDLPHVAFGNSDAARVGDWVIAVGNPFGLGGTVSAGIVSARGRDIQSASVVDFLQVDAAINRGNSGGPLLDTEGRVVGINTAIYSPNGGSVGIGFAIPANVAKPVIDELRKTGEVARGWLGVQIQALTPEIAESLNLGKQAGALVAKVVPESPAAKAGLRQGDVILGVDGKDLAAFKDLPRRIAALKPGAAARLTVWRQGRTRELRARIAPLPGNDRMAARATGKPGGERHLGLALAPLNAEARTQYRLAVDAKGVLVTGVDSGSPAARAGLRRGDVIVMIAQQRVKRPADIAGAIEKATAAKRDAVLLLIDRQGDERFVTVRLARA